jgi:hypothetical protein
MRATPFTETPFQGFRAPIPRMHLWPTVANNSPVSEWDQTLIAHIYETPTARRQVPNFSGEETPAAASLDPKFVNSHLYNRALMFLQTRNPMEARPKGRRGRNRRQIRVETY